MKTMHKDPGVHADAQARRGRADERRTAIAAAARALIVEKGFEGLRTREIADRVGINIATLHYHVPSKQDLIELVAASLKQDFAESRAAWWRPGLSARDELRLEIAEHVAIAKTHPELFVVFAEMTNRARHDPGIEAVMAPLRRFWYEQIRALLARGIAECAFRPDLDPEAGAHLVIGTLTALNDCPDFDTNRTLLTAISEEIMRAVGVR